jgi:uncharacterized iron-regulated protein
MREGALSPALGGLAARASFCAAVFACASMLTACAAAPAPRVAASPAPEGWFNASGEPLSYAVVLQNALASDAVLLGEVHGHARGHAELGRLFGDVLARRSTAELGLEFFERHQQGPLDAYLRGELDEPAFVAASQRTDGNYPPGHRAMLEAARTRQARVWAANAPRSLVRRARLEGYEALRSLPAAEQALFRIAEPPPGGAYLERFVTLMQGTEHLPPGHPPVPANGATEALFRSQALWDATMADTVVQRVGAGARPFVLVVGSFHVERQGGVTQLVERWAPAKRRYVVVVSPRPPGAFVAADRGLGDAIFYAGSEGGGAGEGAGG